MATKKAAVKTAKKPAPKKATKKAATKSATEKTTASLQMFDDGKNYNVKITGNLGDIVAMIKQCMEEDNDLKNIIRIAAIL